MPNEVVFYETPRSRKGRLDAGGRTLTRVWFCQGTNDQTEVYELALATLDNCGDVFASLRADGVKGVSIDPTGRGPQVIYPIGAVIHGINAATR